MKLEKYYADVEDNEGNWEWCDVVKWTPELQEAWDNRAFAFNGKIFVDTVAKYPISMMDALLLMEVAIQKRIADGY